MKAWRDVDSENFKLGVVMSTKVVSIYFGKRLYRLKWHLK